VSVLAVSNVGGVMMIAVAPRLTAAFHDATRNGPAEVVPVKQQNLARCRRRSRHFNHPLPRLRVLIATAGSCYRA